MLIHLSGWIQQPLKSWVQKFFSKKTMITQFKKGRRLYYFLTISCQWSFLSPLKTSESQWHEIGWSSRSNETNLLTLHVLCLELQKLSLGKSTLFSISLKFQVRLTIENTIGRGYHPLVRLVLKPLMITGVSVPKKH